MALTRKSKMKEIFANEQAYAILLKHVPTCTQDNPGMAAALNMSAEALLSFPASKCHKSVREAFYEELEAANLE